MSYKFRIIIESNSQDFFATIFFTPIWPPLPHVKTLDKVIIVIVIIVIVVVIIIPALGTKEDKIEHLLSYAHVVHTTAKQVISRRRKNENIFKMSNDEKCTCKAGKNPVFHCRICKFVAFLLPSSSWLLKLPISENNICKTL